MTWVYISDDMPEHPRIVAAGTLGMALYVAGICYCNRSLTDGFIPAGIAGRLVDLDAPADVVATLVAAGLWEPVEGGWRIHGYLDYQKSRDEILALREAKSAGGKARAATARLANGRYASSPPAGAPAGAPAAHQQEHQENTSPSPSPSPSPRPSPVPSPPPSPEEEDAPPTPPRGGVVLTAEREAVNRPARLKATRPEPDPELPADFARFWAAYPRKDAKQACLRWWLTHRPDPATLDAMLAAVERAGQSAQWQRDGGRFIPMPSTYLNQRRWEDEGPTPDRPPLHERDMQRFGVLQRFHARHAGGE